MTNSTAVCGCRGPRYGSCVLPVHNGGKHHFHDWDCEMEGCPDCVRFAEPSAPRIAKG